MTLKFIEDFIGAIIWGEKMLKSSEISYIRSKTYAPNMVYWIGLRCTIYGVPWRVDTKKIFRKEIISEIIEKRPIAWSCISVHLCARPRAVLRVISAQIWYYLASEMASRRFPKIL